MSEDHPKLHPGPHAYVAETSFVRAYRGASDVTTLLRQDAKIADYSSLVRSQLHGVGIVPPRCGYLIPRQRTKITRGNQCRNRIPACPC
jgi:hypothetical protein